MQKRMVMEKIYWLGAVDWDRRLFDSLIPLPDGTTYNAYLIEGSEKTALLDTVDPSMAETLMAQLDGVDKIDFIVSHHAEQDHSGSIIRVLEKFPEAKVVVTSKGKNLLMDLFAINESSFVTVADGETISLGDKTLKFIHTPWVHWPETMVTYLQENKLLFSCDFYGSHIASGDLFVTDQGRVNEAAKRYFAEIMMPFRSIIEKNMQKLEAYDIQMIAPSHGQIYDRPAWIMDAYRDWVSGPPHNLVVLPFVSMHGSTRQMVDRLTSALVAEEVRVEMFNLAVTDIGKLAMALVDAATVIIGVPTVLAGPHPLAAYAALLANALKPKVKFLSIIGSYGWGGKTVETLSAMIPNLKAEILDPVMCKGAPSAPDLNALDRLAATIAKKHKENKFQ
ncbi:MULTISPECIES: FprA family A-type flavoprotein [Desulfococcus]|jgi:flavorubredoxin|uniref:Beta-lactamase domain protein n=1 Tax=Desulfococcus multivorans DSM 2059 TaxID=1121405 RepID=S7VFL1_DESML|nr:FprA family A-type flavoprotein [Desulfococcus multivorans]AOY58455.1 Roo2: rubredoxin-oxygen oxidoreductase [Desulfococcus multivorans]AQV00772.1 MBL fold metallo-hydrolase [Desulfococcus multivorans]EPR43243.1 beta-lactamase domain protein [Desulfococcus multivorans DSM 2059]MDX9819153.1 FprA family A-type flavoprotein [Desulfococcus multivorans]SJZ40952.1 Flavorubredoxin [Desulfococcus multivorans DSM 2059]